MLTRIEIDGFKTFRNFKLDIAPFLVVLGRNASGKSNMFDAIQFLGATADGTLMEAVQSTRGDLSELTHHYTDGSRVDTIKIAVEALLDSAVTDDFGDAVLVRHSRLRYELELQVRPVVSDLGAPDNERRERLFVARERVTLIRQPDDKWIEAYGGKTAHRRNLAQYSSRAADVLLDTIEHDGRPVFELRQQGRAGKPKLLPAGGAVATVLSTLTTAHDFPLLYALKKELLSWGLLHLDPQALRSVNSYDDDDVMTSAGENLANALRRISLATATPDRPVGALPDIAADLARIIPDVVDLKIDEDRQRRQRQVVVVTRDDAPYTARVASDGTLRALALLTALYDPQSKGLICFEEPENGIYPQRLVQFVTHLGNLVHEALCRRREDPSAPGLQLVLSSHSPVILKAMGRGSSADPYTREDVVFIDSVSLVTSDGISRVSRPRRIALDDQTRIPNELMGAVVSQAEIEAFQVEKLLA